MKELHVVLGAGGNIGAAVVNELIGRGKEVRAITRSGRADLPEAVAQAAADATDRQSLGKAVKGAAAIYHCIGVPYQQWTKIYPPVMTNLIEAAADQGSDTRVVYADNLYCYGREGALRGPLTEETPHLAAGKKGKLRSAMIDQILRAHRDGRIRAVIGQASDFFGPGGDNSILDFFLFRPLVEGRQVRILADLDRRHSFIYLPDFSRFLVDLALDDRAYGQAWILPHMEVLTYREFLDMAYQEAGLDPDGMIRTMPKSVLTLGSLMSSTIREVKEVAYQTQVDWVADWSKYRGVFAGEPTPIRRALSETIAWYCRSLYAENER
jgi:nucleoside-diphosphate-sugar epimerase